jgi:hypothetical protein
MNDVEDIPEAELGAELDRAIDGRIEAENAEHLLNEANALLDTAADGRDLPTSLMMDIRHVQEEVRSIAAEAGDEAEAAGERAAKIRERL